MTDIFISYSKKDREKAAFIAKALEDAGWTVWWDPQIPVGKTWRQVIAEAIEAAQCVLVLWSKISITSDWVLEEAEYGRNMNIYLPVLIEETQPPFGFRQIQAANLTDWHGDVNHPQYRQLLNAIEDMLGGEEPPGKALQTETQAAGLSEGVDQRITEAGLDVIYAPRGGYELVRIPGGEFLMGSPDSKEDRNENEGPQHPVQVPDFYMGRYPVTNEEYGRYLAENADATEPKYWADRQFNRPRQPVVGVSWKDARQYARWAGLQLPSEAQWEYACRAGSQTRFYSGDAEEDLGRVGWYNENSDGKLHPVGEKQPNVFGLYDMHGNVLEWVEDDSHDSYDSAPDDGRAWIDSPRGARVFRGGSWFYPARLCRSAYRYRIVPGDRNSYLGFRLVLLPGQPG